MPVVRAHDDHGPYWFLDLPRGKSGNEDLERAWLQAVDQVFKVFCEKQQDYGPENIGRMGEAGVAVRAFDKCARLKTLLGAAERPANESIEDSWIDLADYGLIGMMVRDGAWPKVEGPDDRCPTCGCDYARERGHDEPSTDR